MSTLRCLILGGLYMANEESHQNNLIGMWGTKFGAEIFTR